MLIQNICTPFSHRFLLLHSLPGSCSQSSQGAFSVLSACLQMSAHLVPVGRKGILIQFLQPCLGFSELYFRVTFAVREAQRKSEILKFCFPSMFSPSTFSNQPHDSMGFCFRTALYSVYQSTHTSISRSGLYALIQQVPQYSSRFILKILILLFLRL